MRKAIFLLLLLAAFAFAAEQTVTEKQFGEETQSSPLEIARDWKVLAVMSLVLSAILVAIGYAVGTGFEMPEVKAWASNEMTQIIANVFIIGVLVAGMVLLDGIVVLMVMDSGINVPECSSVGKSCLQAVTTDYLEDYVETAETGAKDTLMNNMKAAHAASIRIGLYCTTAFLPLFCLQAGFTSTVAGQYMLDQDMYAILFEYYTGLLSSMEAQKFFVTEICFKMAPVALAIGVVARAFYFTRKIGGLMIAAAVGLMFFFPGMYIFDWVTLDMAVNGDKLMDADEPLCPAECSLIAPRAYYDGGVLTGPPDVYGAFSDDDAELAAQIIEGSIASATGSNSTSPANGKTIYSCFYGGMAACGLDCRELPYPAASGNCSLKDVEEACAAVPIECKVKRLVDTTDAYTFDLDEYNRCPASCKVVPPLKSDCDTDRCMGSRFDCRLAKRSDLDWRPSTVDVEGSNYAGCVHARDCPASLIAEESCVFVIPDSGRCNDLCPDCPPECRIRDAELDDLPAQCKNEDGDELISMCSRCNANYDSCTIGLSDITSLEPPPEFCGSCPVTRRLVYTILPEEYITGGCTIDACPKDYRAAIPRNTCESCLFTEEKYVYAPSINTRCADLCSTTGNSPAKKPGEYTKIGGDGLVGKPEIINVAKLMVPAYLLPLFNIVATLIFIKGLSGILGGDIEIPGISKVF